MAHGAMGFVAYMGFMVRYGALCCVMLRYAALWRIWCIMVHYGALCCFMGCMAHYAVYAAYGFYAVNAF